MNTKLILFIFPQSLQENTHTKMYGSDFKNCSLLKLSGNFFILYIFIFTNKYLLQKNDMFVDMLLKYCSMVELAIKCKNKSFIHLGQFH